MDERYRENSESGKGCNGEQSAVQPRSWRTRFLAQPYGRCRRFNIYTRDEAITATRNGFDKLRYLGRVMQGAAQATDCMIQPVIELDVRILRPGFHVFRRRLDNSNISGLTLRHPYAGPCILVNYSEDVYRQRFTAAHEGAHAICDSDHDIVVSFTRWDRKELIEIRANAFAATYLLPPSVLQELPVKSWNQTEIVRWADKLKVNATVLAIALKENKIINETTFGHLKGAKIRVGAKTDPELAGLSSRSLERKRSLLERGLSSQYVTLCFDAMSEDRISAARAAEMMLIPETALPELASLFGVTMLTHD